MSKSISSARIKRLNLLLRTLEMKPNISRAELINECGYRSGRTLEDDLSFLKNSFGAKIRYSRSSKSYIFEGAGNYVLNGGEAD